MAKYDLVTSAWHLPQVLMIPSSNPSVSVLRIEWAVWQLSHTGSGFVECETLTEWMLCSNCALDAVVAVAARRRQVAGVHGRGRVGGRQDRVRPCGSLVHIAVTSNPLCTRPLPWMLSE